MPTRSSVITVPTPIQGDDAWVKVKRPTVGEMEEIYNRFHSTIDAAKDFVAGSSLDPNIAVRDELLTRFVHAWNWVDDDGVPLPQIKDDPTVIKRLLASEVNVLYEAIVQQDDIKKKV